MIGIHVLPGEKKTTKILGRDWLNFRAQSIDREPMNSRQQPPVAPFLFRGIWMKLSTQDETFHFKGKQRGFDFRARQSQAARKIDDGEWSGNFHSSAHQFAKRISANCPVTWRFALAEL